MYQSKKEKKKRKGKVGIFVFISIFFMEDKLGFPNKNNKIIWEYPKKDEPDFFFFLDEPDILL